MNRPATVISFLSLGVALGLMIRLIIPVPDTQQTIEWMDNPRSLEAFSLETEVGNFNNQSLSGRWTLVVFGFLHCPDICPSSLLELASLADGLAEKGLNQQVSFVFVSVDPMRDSVAEIAQYVQHFHPSILGATGDEEQLIRLAGNLGIRFEVSPDDKNYTVAHSVTFSIIGPGGGFYGRFRPGFDVPNLVRSFMSKFGERGVI